MYIYKESEIRKIDQEAALSGLSENTLMETAGRSLFYELKKLLSKKQRILILAGRGNNGGDAIVLARYLLQNGYHGELVFPMGLPKSKSAKEHFTYYKSLGFPYHEKIRKKEPVDVIVDGLLGIGVKLPLLKELSEIIHWCNEQEALKIAIDIPTGVQADSGEVDLAFQADITFCLHGFKPSAFLLPSAYFYGNKKALDIGLLQTSRWRMWTKKDVQSTLKKRDIYSHKGTFGTGLLLAGSEEMPGSMMLAAMGALHAGIGKLMIGTEESSAAMVCSKIPEATFWYHGLEKVANGEFPAGIKACAVGPGIVDQELVEKAIGNLMKTEIPIVLDAGALLPRTYPKRNAPIVLTPHPGEFARILNISVYEVQKNRMELARSYAEDNGVIVVLKGRDTVIAYPDGTGFINPTGNPALAKGGSGDTLTGILLAFLCSEENPYYAVANAVYLHGLCADFLIEKRDERSVSASVLAENLGFVLKELLEEKIEPAY